MFTFLRRSEHESLFFFLYLYVKKAPNISLDGHTYVHTYKRNPLIVNVV